ncbi:MAG: hypothetical protein HC811_10820, partial [Flammeovirgaceae bacterium]|nr:hypothetical protein [Flammeovirgaceae bacterium]
NRMTLQEITDIVNEPDLTTEVVGGVLDIFRAEGNSFIRPFKTDDPQSQTLRPGSVLDITHESLIRNWGKLNTWAQKEFEFYSTYLDFKKQLDRWKVSNKSLSYLLPIGPLTYFEKWYAECKPNRGWIKRYSEVVENEEQANEQAAEVLADTQEFIRRSANTVIITRTFMKYGPQRIATFFAIAAMIFLSGFYWYDAEQKQNDLVIKRLQEETAQLIASDEVGNNFKANSLLISERLDSGYLISYLTSLDSKQRIGLANESYKVILEFDKNDRSALKWSLINELLDQIQKAVSNEKDVAFVAAEVNKFTTLLAYDEYFNPSSETKAILMKVSDWGYTIALKSFNDQSLFQATLPIELNYAVQNWLTFGDANPENIDALLKHISPLGGETSQSNFNRYYPKGSYETNGRIPNDYNGGYHTLASLYAARGQVNNIIWCFDQLHSTGQNDYFIGSLFNNYNHVLGILYQYGFKSKSQPMIDWLSSHYESDTPITIYRNSFIRSGYMAQLYRVNIEKDILRSYKGYFFPNLTLADRNVSNELALSYEQEILKEQNPHERNYLLALNYKRKAMFTAKYNSDRGFPNDDVQINGWLDKFVEHYRKVPASYLEETVPVTIPYYGDGVRNRQFKRRQLMLYPDYIDGWFSWTFHSDALFNYLRERNLFTELYTKAEDFDYLHFWIAKANEKKAFVFDASFDSFIRLSDDVYEGILNIADQHVYGRNFDRNLTYLILANRYFEARDVEKGIHYYSLFDQNSISRSADRYEYVEKTFFLNQMKDLCVNLANHGYYNEGEELAEKFEKEHEKIFAYIFMADKIFQDRGDPKSFIYLDSAFSKAKSVDVSQFTFGAFTNLNFQIQLLMVMGRIGGEEMNQKALDIYREMVEGSKTQALVAMNIGIGDEGNLHRAVEAIPPTLTESEDLLCRSVILWQAARKKDNRSERWIGMDKAFLDDFYYIFYLPN